MPKDTPAPLLEIVADPARIDFDRWVERARRGEGISRALMNAIDAHPELQNLRRFTLATRDAHGLYAKYGFTPLAAPDRLMERRDPDVYKRHRDQPA